MKSKKIIRIGVSGINGKMGKQIILDALKFPGIKLGAAFCRSNSKIFGMDVGELCGIKKLGIKVSDNFQNEKNNFDVLIDFTCPKSSLLYLKYCQYYKKNVVIGTTGFNKLQKKKIIHASNEIAIIISENFSFGMNLIFKYLKNIASNFDKDTDIVIIDTHHRNKSQYPSGTAIKIGKIIFHSINKNHEKYQEKFKKHRLNINYSSIRTNNVTGKHTILFFKDGECLEITHRVNNRSTFSKYAIHAAMWIYKHKLGFFNMNDIFKFMN